MLTLKVGNRELRVNHNEKLGSERSFDEQALLGSRWRIQGYAPVVSLRTA